MKKLLMSAIAVSTAYVMAGYVMIEDGARVIAHRGYWNIEGSAQNSIAALQKAAEISVYGSEFDVNVTSDGIPVINHDVNIDGVVIEQNPYSVFKDHILSNGECIPTLEEYLREGKKFPEMKMILEIKSASNPEFESNAVRIIMDMVERMEVKKQVEYIAFSLHICKEIVKADPKATVAYLNGDVAPAELKKAGIPGLDYHFSVMDGHPDWFSEAEDNGMPVNVWTVNAEQDMRRMIESGADFITTDDPELLQKVLTGF